MTETPILYLMFLSYPLSLLYFILSLDLFFGQE